MKKLIREILSDLNTKPQPPLPTDLDNQVLSKKHEEMVRQLDQQAHEQEQIESD
jgi:hypothetical protein